MRDSFGRTIDYLRISVTDRCNFRCVYCMPEEGADVAPKEWILRYEEIATIVKVAAELGVRKVRLTGGEPLVRKDIVQLVRMIAQTPGITEVSMTTNGFLLARYAHELKEAGLTRINISLDTLNPERFVRIARRGSLQQVLEGIEAARQVGLSPIKLNMVVMRGFNDDEVADFARLTLRHPYHVRFIELMPINWNDGSDSGEFLQQRFWNRIFAHTEESTFQLIQAQHASHSMLSAEEMRRLFVPVHEIRQRIEQEVSPLEPAEVITNGPARTFRLPGAQGTVGFISQVTHDFCANCNRLRLTADGFLRPCLMADGEVDLRAPLREGKGEEEIRRLFLHTVAHKPERHYLAEGIVPVGRGMSQLGG
ncbi:GTP 3',8-cyclase [bacterium HR16]|nr:GTP 3',8-cyclase [bacterium HR16]